MKTLDLVRRCVNMMNVTIVTMECVHTTTKEKRSVPMDFTAKSLNVPSIIHVEELSSFYMGIQNHDRISSFLLSCLLRLQPLPNPFCLLLCLEPQPSIIPFVCLSKKDKFLSSFVTLFYKISYEMFYEISYSVIKNIELMF